MSAYETVIKARNKDRQTGLCYIKGIFTDFIEFHGDRRYGDDPAIVGGIARLDDMPVTIIAMEKGNETKERVRRNFGSPYPEGYRKSLRLMHQAEKFGRPIITFVDTAGAFCGIGAEERGQGEAIAENICELMKIKVPVIAVLIGEGGSGGALALAVADRVWIMENAVYSVVSPEGCASILWKDPNKAPKAAECLKITAEDMKNYSIVEKVISEKQDVKVIFKQLGKELYDTVDSIRSEGTEKMLEERYNRFRKF
jgi:acetyl-CoA carboxylase carboxyl transferase subunit alpha